MAFKFPPLERGFKISDASGIVSDAFARFWQKFGSELTKQETTQDALLQQILTAQAAASAAQASANAANASSNSVGSGKVSGTSNLQNFSCSSVVRATIATVNLTGVVAGTLRFDTTSIFGSYPLTSLIGTAFSGNIFITEQSTSGGAVTDIYSGSITAVNDGEGGIEFTYDQAAIDALRPTAVNVGNVTYRLQIAKTGSVNLIDASCILRAAQA